MSGQDFACGSGDFSKFPSLMIALTISRGEYFVPLLIWPCLNIGTCKTLRCLQPPYHRCLTSVGVCVIFLAVNLLALSGIARASSWHNEYPERLITVSKFQSILMHSFDYYRAYQLLYPWLTVYFFFNIAILPIGQTRSQIQFLD